MTISDIQIAKAIAKLHAEDVPILAEIVEAVIAFVKVSDDEAVHTFRLRMIGLQRDLNERDRREILNDE